MLIGGLAALWPLLVAAPVIGGPLVALAVGAGAWLAARTAVPLPHANDNEAWPPSRGSWRRDKRMQQRFGAQAMFGGNDKAQPRRSGGLSVIDTDMTVTGNLHTQGDLHIDGTVDGDVSCRSLVQGPSGKIVGCVTATSARLAGTIEGRVTATTLVVEKAARLHGDATYGTLHIENGAQVDGRVTPLAETSAADPPLRLVDSSEAG